MSNAGTAFSFDELVDAASLPIAWTSRRPRIKIGLRPTARGRLLPPAAEQSLPRSSTRNEQEAATKFAGKFVRRRGDDEGGWEEEEESSNGDGSRAGGPNRGFIFRGVPLLPSGRAAYPPFCHRIWLPKLPPRGSWQCGDLRGIRGFLVHEGRGDPCGLLSCPSSVHSEISSLTDVTAN